jgi:hypothetical protein
MSEQALPLNVSASRPSPETIRTFTQLVARWRAETEYISSTSRLVEHPAYQEIISMGPAVIPLLLCELAQEPDFWFAALQHLTGQDPVRPEQQGKIQEMANAWLEWGKEHGYRW